MDDKSLLPSQAMANDVRTIEEEGRFFRPSQYLILERLNDEIDTPTSYNELDNFGGSTLTRTYDKFESSASLIEQPRKAPAPRGRPKKQRKRRDISDMIAELQ